MNLYAYQRLRSFFDLGPRTLRSTFSNFFFWETVWPTEAKFYVQPPLDGETKVWTNSLGHMTKMAAMPIYGKNSKSHLLLDQKVDDLESWYAALGIQVLPNLFKWCPWDDLDLFHGKVKFDLCFWMEKRVKQWIFSETTVVYDIKVGRCSQLNEYMNPYEYQRSRSFIQRFTTMSYIYPMSRIVSVLSRFDLESFRPYVGLQSC